MCGIFGLVAQKGFSGAVFQQSIRALFQLSESRGKEAAGAAARFPNELSLLKGPLRASHFLRTRQYQDLESRLTAIDGGLGLIGHSRLVTHGSQDRHQNNQPVAKSGMVCVHNGIVANEARLWRDNPDLDRLYDVDTEVLLSLIGKHVAAGASLSAALRETYAALRGSATLAILFQDRRALSLSTNTGSQYVCLSLAKDALVFASELFILKELCRTMRGDRVFQEQDIEHYAAGRAVVVDMDTLELRGFSLEQGSPDVDDLAAHSPVPVNDLGEVAGRVRHTPAPHSFLNPETSQAMLGNWQRFYERDPVRRCTKCLLPETMPGVSFDSDGVCNHCRFYAPHVVLGHEALRERVKPFRGNGSKPDCLVPFSGGRDSCYGLLYIKEQLGMTPIAYTYDWGMITDLGRRNQARVVGKLGVEHIIVSADIDKKRDNIRRNIEAWLKRPRLGMIPLWMAGDKQLLYFARKVMRQNKLQLIMYSYGNKMEEVNHKIGFAGVTVDSATPHQAIPLRDKLRLFSYYSTQLFLSPGYINSSLVDSAFAFWSLFIQPDESIHLFKYLDWDEDDLLRTIIGEFDWEMEPDTCATWRIDDGTVAFYNYVYLMVAGFTENDGFRSCQIRQGKLTRDEALQMVKMENKPRLESIEWYAKTIGFDINRAIRIIDEMPKLYKG